MHAKDLQNKNYNYALNDASEQSDSGKQWWHIFSTIEK